MIGSIFKRKAPFGMNKEQERRYAYEKDAYWTFLSCMSDKQTEDLDYLDFVIDLLRKEVKYSSLLETSRRNSKGTDYRLLLLYQLCRQKYFMEQQKTREEET